MKSSCITSKFDVEHDERYDPLVQIVIKIWVVDTKSSCIASNLVLSTSMTRKAASGQLISSKNTASGSNDLSLPLDVDAVCLLQAGLPCRSCTTALPGYFELTDRLVPGQLLVVLKQVSEMISVVLAGPS